MAFNKDNRSGRGRDSGRRGSFGADREMFKTVCSKCGKDCEVPFRPTGSKPVYCRDCFRSMGGPDSRRSDDRGSRKSSFDNRSVESNNSQNRGQFEAINTKLDQILKLLNPEKIVETPKSTADAKHTVDIRANSTDNAEPVKKKVRAKKPSRSEDIAKPAEVVVTDSTTEVTPE